MAPRHLGEHRVAQAGGLQRAVALRNRAAPAMGEKLVRVIQGRPSPDLVHLRTLAGRAVELVQLGVESLLTPTARAIPSPRRARNCFHTCAPAPPVASG